MINPDDMMLRPPTAEERAAGVPADHVLGQFRCPECGTWVASKTKGGIQSWLATGDDRTADGRKIDPSQVWISNLSPSVNIDGDHERKYPFSQRGETCPGWHGWYRDGRWVSAG